MGEQADGVEDGTQPPAIAAITAAEARARVDVLTAYRGSNADVTKALYGRLGACGALGAVAVNLLRASKNSERAKLYRGRSNVAAAYDTKGWALEQLAKALAALPAEGGLRWGWGLDEKEDRNPHVIYVDLPNGQVSFHSPVRGKGPDYPEGWDGQRGVSAGRVCTWAGKVLAEREGKGDGNAGT